MVSCLRGLVRVKFSVEEEPSLDITSKHFSHNLNISNKK